MVSAIQIKTLIVDDQVTSRLLLAEALQQMGVKQISAAKDGEEALSIFMKEPHHLIISDYNMPKMNGIELLRAVRANANGKRAAFIILTARGDQALVQQAAAYGANNILSKPFTLDKLRASIEAVFGQLA